MAQIKAPKVSLELIGEKDFLTKLKLLNKKVRDEVKSVIAESANNIVTGAQRRTPVDMGQLRASIRPKYLKGGMVGEIHVNAEYGAFIEYGTGPLGRSTNKQPLPAEYTHGASVKRPPTEIIAKWCQRHGIDPAFAFVIAKRISARGGLPARPYLGPAFNEEKDPYLQALRAAINGEIDWFNG